MSAYLYRAYTTFIFCISIFLCMLVTACGGGGDNNAPLTSDEDPPVFDQTSLFFLEQVTGSSGSGSGVDMPVPSNSSNESSTSTEPADTYNIYRVDIAANGQSTKINSAPFEHFLNGYLVENSEGSERVSETIIWIQDELLIGATTSSAETFSIDASSLASPLCKLDYFRMDSWYAEYSTHKLTVGGSDLDCDTEADNQYYLVQAKPNGTITEMSDDEYAGQYGYTVYADNGDQSVSMYKVYYDDSRGVTEVINSETQDIVVSYAFELPQGSRFMANNRTYILDDDRLYYFTAAELISGSFDPETSSIALSEWIGGYALELPPEVSEAYSILANDWIAQQAADKVYLSGEEGIKTLILETGQVSPALAWSTNLSYPNLNFVEGSDLLFVIDNRIVYRVDLSSGQVDQLYQTTSSHYGWSLYGHKLLFTEYSGDEDAKATHIIDLVDGLVFSYQDASWEYIYYSAVDGILLALIKEGTEANNHRASIELFDFDSLSTSKNLGSASVDDFELGYSPGRYRLATDGSKTQVYLFDLETENSIRFITQVEGEVRL